MAQTKNQNKTGSKSGPKVAVIVSPGKAKWGSCHAIGSNLQRAYELCIHQLPKNSSVEFIEYGDSLSNKGLLQLARSIAAKKYSHISFVDHWPPAFGLIRALLTVSKGRSLPAILLHVYGDFTFYSTDMVSTFYLLRGHHSRPVCASHRQMNLVNRLLNTDKKSIGYVPFPVDTQTFFPSDSLRQEERKLQGWSADDFVVLYTGRISMQKNVTIAISQFFAHLKKTGQYKTKRRYKFVFCGKYDDLGAPFFGQSSPGSEYFFRVRNTMAEVDPKLGSVTYLGNFEPEKLNRIYNAADAFMSLSLHHDEDFGMSPAEALATGLPCALSDWGGYSSFASLNSNAQKQVFLIPVGTDNKGLYFYEPYMHESLSAILAARQSSQERMKAAKRFQESFGIEAVSQNLVQQIELASQSMVNGPSKPFLELAKRSLDIRDGRADKIYHSYADPLYRSIYSAYQGME